MNDIQTRKKKVQRRIDRLQTQYEEANIPEPAALWKMGDDELMHSVNLELVSALLREHFKISDEEWLLYLNECLANKLESLLPRLIELRSELTRRAITDGI
jgi:hypothetical protein